MKRRPRPVIVTDHAVLRYIERRHGLDVEALRAEIAASCATGAAYGAHYVLADGVRYVLRSDGPAAVCVTVLARQWPASGDR